MIPGVQLEARLRLIDDLDDGKTVAQPLQGAVARRPVKDDVAAFPVGRHRWVDQPAVYFQPLHEPRHALLVDVFVGRNEFDGDDLQVERLVGPPDLQGGNHLAGHLQGGVAALVVQHGGDVGRDAHARVAAHGQRRRRGSSHRRRQIR